MSVVELWPARCVLCGGRGHLAIPKPPRAYLRCSDCGCLWLEPRPTDSELAAFYEDGNFYAAARAAEPRLRALSTRRLEAIRGLLGSTGSILDVGCADGVFLEEAARSGCVAVGVEPSTALAARARDKGLTVHGQLSAARVEGGYAAVTAWEVIEHVGEPALFLADVVAQLAPGGLLALSTPDAASLSAKLLGARFPFASSPEHVLLYSRKALRQILASHGLEVVRERGFSGFGLGEARAMLARRIGPAFVFLAPLVVAAFAVLDWLGQGTEMEVYAVRGGAPR